MRAPALVLLCAALPSAAAPPLDGVYVVNRPEGVAVFELRGDEVEFVVNRTHSWTGTFQRDERVLTFAFEHTTVRTTWALVEGVLWLGAMVPDPRGPGRWVSLHERSPSMHPRLPMEGPEEAVLDERAGVWMSKDPLLEASTARHVVRRFEVSDGFWPVVEKVVLGDPWVLSADCPDAACLASQARQRGRPFIQKGSVVLAPWSVAVGKPGVVPARLPAKALLGRWSKPGGETVLLAEAPDARRSGDFRDTPEPRQLAVREGRGVYVEHWGRNCMMGHMDVPSTSVFVVLGPDRLLLHTHVGGHHAARLPPTEVVLRRQPR